MYSTALLRVWMFSCACISILSSDKCIHTEVWGVCHMGGRSMFPPNDRSISSSGRSTCDHRAVEPFSLVHLGPSESTVEGTRLPSGTSYKSAAQ